MAKPALSRERIVDAAITILDTEGEDGLTFRALASRLATGPGALYWHIANKSELLVAAGDAVVARALADVAPTAAPRRALRGVALGVFDAVDAHPWVGALLSRGPWQDATLLIFERIGSQLHVLGVPPRAQFTAASALLSYIIGVSVQNAAQGRALAVPATRDEVLAAEASRWAALDADAYPFLRSVAAKLPRHDDRAEYLAGVELILAGIAAPR